MIKKIAVIGTGVIGSGWIIRFLAHDKKVIAFYKDIRLNTDYYCKIDINKSYIVYFDHDTISKCE